MNLNFLTKLILIIPFLFSSCNEKEDFKKINEIGINTGVEANNDERIRLDKKISSEKVKTNLNVFVFDETNTPISNAIVTIANKTVYTNSNGFVTIENILINKEFQVIKTHSKGYTNSLKTITPSSNGVTNVAITLIKPSFIKSFDAQKGGTIANQKISIKFPAEAIANQSGELYTGEVKATVTYYDPNSTIFSATIPATLVGLDENDNIQALISKGMITVDLTDTSGNEVEIFEGKKATITLPATNNDPQKIDLWHLNEEKGIWVQTGIATKINNEYVTTVNHFSTYNLDIKVDPININFILKNTDNKYLSNQKAYLQITSNVGNYERTVYTDNKGEFKLINAIKGADYSISLKTKCENEIVIPAGIINKTTTKELTLKPSSNLRTITLKGTLKECGTILANKVFVINLSNGSKTDIISAYTNSEGKYSVTSLLCDYDTTTKYQGEIRIYDGNNDIVKNNEFIFKTAIVENELVVCGGAIEAVTERIFTGDYFMNSNKKYEDFIAGGYTKITGDLRISNVSTTDLRGLIKLKSMGGSFLSIENCPLLTSLDGLNNLAIMGEDTTGTQKNIRISINNNFNLINLNGLDKLQNLEKISISSNDNLVSLDGLEKTGKKTTSFTAIISLNKSLTDITSLSDVTNFEILAFAKNNKLENLSGLENTTHIDVLNIIDNALLTNLDELNNLTYLGALKISSNKNLIDFCSLNKDHISNGNINTIEGGGINNNAFNPTKADLVNGNCSK